MYETSYKSSSETGILENHAAHHLFNKNKERVCPLFRLLVVIRWVLISPVSSERKVKIESSEAPNNFLLKIAEFINYNAWIFRKSSACNVPLGCLQRQITIVGRKYRPIKICNATIRCPLG